MYRTSCALTATVSCTVLHRFGLEVPWVAAVPRIPVPSQMLARHELSDESTLKWLYPPPGSDTRYPEVPQGLVQELAGKLVESLEQR